MDGLSKTADRQSGDESIILALGGNLAVNGCAPADTLEASLQALRTHGVEVMTRSRLWRSAAWPDPHEPAFLNMVAIVETALAPGALLQVLHRVETAYGRVRSQVDAPRPLDIDLIAYGRLRQDGPPMLPHPRAAERLFVMGPLAEIASSWRHPVLGETAAALAAQATVGRDAAPFDPPRS